MQVNMINGGDLAAHALLFGPPSERLRNYFSTGIQQARDVLGNVGSRFIDAAQTVYNKFNSQAAVNAAKSLIYSLGDHRSELVIQRLLDMDNFRPNHLMQRYIMANPEVGNKHKRNMCHGFADTYFDMEPGVYGKDRAEYRQVMDGVLQFENDDQQQGYFEYFSDGAELEELDPIDTFAILSTWDTVANIIAKGDDPTEVMEK